MPGVRPLATGFEVGLGQERQVKMLFGEVRVIAGRKQVPMAA